MCFPIKDTYVLNEVYGKIFPLHKKSRAANLPKNWIGKHTSQLPVTLCVNGLFLAKQKTSAAEFVCCFIIFCSKSVQLISSRLLHCQDSLIEKPFLLSKEHFPELKYIVIWRCRSNWVTKILVYFSLTYVFLGLKRRFEEDAAKLKQIVEDKPKSRSKLFIVCEQSSNFLSLSNCFQNAGAVQNSKTYFSPKTFFWMWKIKFIVLYCWLILNRSELTRMQKAVLFHNSFFLQMMVGYGNSKPIFRLTKT